MLEQLVENILPPIISVCELIGIVVVTFSVLAAFWHYIVSFAFRRKSDIQLELAGGLATGLEFKIAAEILKTVVVRSVDELFMLTAVILLRAVLSFLIHLDMRRR